MQPRFPDVPLEKGHYESFYIRAVHPTEPLGLWLRHTIHKKPGEQPTAALWCTLFTPDGPVALKEQTTDLDARDGEYYVRIGPRSTFGTDSRITGEATAPDGKHATWALTYRDGAEPLHHLPRDWMYTAPLPRTKTRSPHPRATFSGTATVEGRTVELDGWHGMVGHNWGAEHAERWVWLHGVAFDGADDAWFDGVLGRVKVGGATTPWIGNGAIEIDGTRYRLGGIERARRTKVEASAEGCRFVLPGDDGLRVEGHVRPRKFVGWRYADPAGGEHHTINDSIAGLDLHVHLPGGAQRTLSTGHGATYELGMRETDHGVRIQPYEDG